VIAEVLVRYFHYSRLERSRGASYSWSSFRNDYVRETFKIDSECSFLDTIVPHPYLGFVHRNSLCGSSNNRGFVGANIPLERDPDFFTILIVGGSVAEQMAIGVKGVSWLEKELNARYISPNGKPFKILNGAVGDWGFPNQNTIVTLYGDVADGIVTLDGYNEASRISEFAPVGKPDVWTYQSVVGAGFTPTVIGIRVLQYIRRQALHWALIKHSFLSFFIFERFMAVVENSGNQNKYQQENLFRFFDFPADWAKEKRRAWNKEKYKTYLRLLRAEAEALNLHYAHFLQPMRGIGKELTEEEKSYKEFVSVDDYKGVIAVANDELKKSGYPTYSLLHIFKDEKGVIYGDHIHCKYTPDWESPGYAIMGRAIANDLSEAWKLKTK